MENKKEKNKNGKMTLDKLAGMVARGFEKTATKEDFAKVTIRLESVEERLDRVEKKLSKVEYRVQEVYDILVSEEKQVLNLQKRIGTLERVAK